jgi:integrase
MGNAARGSIRGRLRARPPRRPYPRAAGIRRIRSRPVPDRTPRVCKAAGIATFSPHDLRHRLVSLLHAQGLTWARIGEAVGHGDLVTTARTYTHVLVDEQELDYADLLG